MKDTKLWKAFSIFIRTRDAVNFSGGETVKCCTCSHTGHWKDFDCGHFISRRHLATKFHERNNHAQCKGCNGFGSGKQFEYSLFIEKTYGKGQSELLLAMSRNTVKYGQFEIDIMEKEYKRKAKELQKVAI